MEDRNLNLPYPSNYISLDEFTERVLCEDNDVINYPLEVWVELQDWLNIPLVPGERTIVSQITQFFRRNVIASGYETIEWFQHKKLHRLNIPTADITSPMRDRSSIPTVGWYLLHYTLPNNLEGIYIIAERQNIRSQMRNYSSSAEVHLIKQPSRKSFVLQEFSADSRRAHNAPYIRTVSYYAPEHVGRTFMEFQEQGGLSTEVFHVYNRLPSLSASQLRSGNK